MVLGYTDTATLPPAAAEHIVLFLLMFANGATGSNYVNHVVSGCRAIGTSTAWHDATVLQAKVAARLRAARLRPAALESPVLSWSRLRCMVDYCDSQGWYNRATMWLLYFDFLLRVQSKGDNSGIWKSTGGRHFAARKGQLNLH